MVRVYPSLKIRRDRRDHEGPGQQCRLRGKLLHTDVSGRPEKSDKEDLVLASIVISERNYQYIDNGIKQIKLKHFPRLADEDVEFHAKDMLNHSGIFKTMSWNEIYAVFTDVFNFLADPLTDLSIIAVLIRKNKLYSGVDPELWSHRLLFERLDTFIGKQNAKLIEAGMGNEYGIMIMDSEGLKKIRDCVTKFLICYVMVQCILN